MSQSILRLGTHVGTEPRMFIKPLVPRTKTRWPRTHLCRIPASAGRSVSRLSRQLLQKQTQRLLENAGYSGSSRGADGCGHGAAGRGSVTRRARHCRIGLSITTTCKHTFQQHKPSWIDRSQHGRPMEQKRQICARICLLLYTSAGHRSPDAILSSIHG